MFPMREKMERWRVPHPWRGILLLLLLTAFTHIWEVSGEFVYDDMAYIALNPAVQNGLTDWERVFIDPSMYSGQATGHYRPLVVLSYKLNRAMGDTTVPFKVTQLFLHVCAVLALFWALSALSRGFVDMHPWLPVVAAGLFGILPFNVEAVHFMSARSAVLCGLFGILSVALYVKMRAANGWRAVGFYGAHLLALVAAVFSKETAITLPGVILAMDLLLIRRAGVDLRSSRFWMPYLPYAVGLMVAISIMPNMGYIFEYLHRVIEEEWRLATAIYCLVENARLMVLPTGLTVAHPIDATVRLTSPATLWSGFILLGMAGATVWAGRRLPLAAFGVVWYLLLIIPSTFVHLTTILLENRGYSSSAGVCMLLAALFFALWEAAARNRTALVVAGGVVVSVFLAMSMVRERVWASNTTLWTDAVAHDPDSYDARHNLATVFLLAGRLEDAAKEYEFLVRISGSEESKYALGRVRVRQGRYADAYRIFEDIAQTSPTNPTPLFEMAVLLQRQNREDEVVSMMRRVVEAQLTNEQTRRYLFPKSLMDTTSELARVAVQAGRPEDAVWAAKILRAHYPGTLKAELLALDVQLLTGDANGARETLNRLRQISPQNPQLPAWEQAVTQLAEPGRHQQR